MKLNARTEKTKSVIHLMVTSLCLRDCPHCCNKQYSLDDVPYVTDEELKDCKTLFITGGEPFIFTNPNNIAYYYRNKYENIKKVIVYTDAYELCITLINDPLATTHIDGLNISIKTMSDIEAFNILWDEMQYIFSINDRVYDFTGKYEAPEDAPFTVIRRKWQEDFEAADDSIFRKV